MWLIRHAAGRTRSFRSTIAPSLITTVPCQRRNMAIDNQLSAGTATPPKAQVPKGKTEVKILMIHGYTQSGALFRAKTRALEKLLAKVLSSVSLHPTLIYPTGPNRLLPRDIPGFVPKDDVDDDEQGDSWAWFRKDEASGQYRQFDQGMDTIATAIRESGGIDGVVGFSQGGFMAGAVASALEETRAPPEGPDGEWARKLRDANGGKGLKFAVPYSGFYAPVESLQWLYEPKIKTPTLHYLGSLDTVVEESRSMGLVDRCEQPVVMTHPGGHHVPVSKEWVMPLAGFIKQHAEVKLQAGL